MKRVITCGRVFVGEKILYSAALEPHNGQTAEIDLSGTRPMALVGSEAFELSVQA